MIAFILTMPSKGSWNNQWSGEGKLYAKFKKNNEVPTEYIGQSFTYRWPDGWTASISVESVDSNTAAKMRKQSAGFCGYDWMIDSIINHGYIISPEDFVEDNGTDEQKYILNLCQLIGCFNHNKDFTHLKNISIKYHDLEVLLENNIINESDELYSGGPTINDMLKFMTKYKNEFYSIKADASNMSIQYKSICKNPYSSIQNSDSINELDNLCKNAPTIDILYDGKTKEYKFN